MNTKQINAACKELLKIAQQQKEELNKTHKALQALRDLCLHKYEVVAAVTRRKNREVCKHCYADRWI